MSCILRPWQLSDAGCLAEIINDQDIIKNLRDGIPHPYTKDDAVSFISDMLNSDPDKVFPFAIVSDGELCGSIAAYRQGNIHCRTAELGIYVAKKFWGRGIATEAVQKIFGHIFCNTDIVRIFAEPFSRNAASCRMLEKAGFELEGTMRQNAYKDGEILDMKLYAKVLRRPD